MRKKTPSFVVELPIRVLPQDVRELTIRLDMHNYLANATLHEALRCVDLMRESKAYQAARKLPKTTKEDRKHRQEVFEGLNKKYGFTSGDLQKFAEKCQKGSPVIARHTGSHDLQTTVKRVFKSVQRYIFGKAGRPWFKKRERDARSVEGKENACIILRAKDGVLVVKWMGLDLPLIVDPQNDWQARALTEHRTKYVRILHRKIRGNLRWYAQIVQEGISPKREGRTVGEGVVGLDLGPSTIAAVSDTDAILETLCPTIEVPEKEIRRLQRKMDRSRRATNPEAFLPDGTYKKGAKIKVYSESYLKLRTKKAEIERRLAAERKRSHGELSNRILAQGATIKTENISVKGWQRSWFGKSVGKRAPAKLMETLSRKVAAVPGGTVTKFSTRKTRLSQVDHTTGTYKKKPLSQREHTFSDGRTVQRDLYTAFLARFVNNDKLDIPQATDAWAGAEPLLGRALSKDENKDAKVKGFPLPYVIRKDGVGATCTPNRSRTVRDVADAVAAVQAVVRAAKNERLRTKNLEHAHHDSG